MPYKANEKKRVTKIEQLSLNKHRIKRGRMCLSTLILHIIVKFFAIQGKNKFSFSSDAF